MPSLRVAQAKTKDNRQKYECEEDAIFYTKTHKCQGNHIKRWKDGIVKISKYDWFKE
jgi:hypothetical protein